MLMIEEDTLPNKLTAAQNADLELDHIQLELSHGRTQHLRHFVDQYYCYSNGYVNRNGRADWGKIFWSGHVSVAASQVEDKSLVVKEHVIPLKVITRLLYELVHKGKVTKDAIKKILETYLIFATITKDENQKLREVKFNSAMPECFQNAGCLEHTDFFCRYHKAGIKMTTLPIV